MLRNILSRLKWCWKCKAITRWKKDCDKIWYCTKCGNDC